MRAFTAWFLGAFCVLQLVGSPALAAPHDVFIDGGGGNYLMGGGKSLLDMRFGRVVRQRFDFSCGSAAVATLLTYYYRHPVKEMDVLQAMFVHGQQDKIRKEGFSMLDMKSYLDAIGYHAAGYRESLDRLAKVGIPAIVLINKRGYMHFVVVTGVTKNYVAVGDPTLGLRVYDRASFEKMWNGILFVLLDGMDMARQSFNTAANWSYTGKPYLRHMLDQGELSSLTMGMALSANQF